MTYGTLCCASLLREVHVTIELPDEQRAIEFERYLKSGSGRAFAKRHGYPVMLQRYNRLRLERLRRARSLVPA